MGKRKSKFLEAVVSGLDFPNKGYANYEDKILTFKGGIVGQKLSLKTARRRQNKIECKVLEILENSPLETETPCDHFSVCGGCSYQRLPYEYEFEMKGKQLSDLFEKNDINFPLQKITPSPLIKGYRNKMEFTFSDEEKGGALTLGMHQRGKFYQVVNIRDCNICDGDFVKIVTVVHEHFLKLGTAPWNKREHKGLLRHLVVRKGLTTGEILVNLVSSSQEDIDEKAFVDAILKEEYAGKITGIMRTLNNSLSDAVVPEELKLLYGQDFYHENLLGINFKITPFSFFQTNSFGAEVLYERVREFVGDSDDKIIFDLYSGTGTIAQILSKTAKKVIGIEIVKEAVDIGNKNIALNKIDNTELICADVLTGVDQLKDKSDIIVIDPPRDGIHPKAINKIIDFKPPVFVYVSCNPVTLVRDLKIFQEKGYEIERLEAVDMFPRTPNLETIVRLKATSC